MNKYEFKEAFCKNKVIIGMIHLKGSSIIDKFERAKSEIDILIGGGFDAVIIEDYYADEDMVERVLHYIYNERPNIGYGVNVLKDYKISFKLANEYKAKFIQIDSVAGHLSPTDDILYEESLHEFRAKSNVLVLGGVRFKYQPILSGRSVEEDLRIGMNRCDAIVVTGKGTGMDTDIEKIKMFRQVMGENFPLIIGAGLTPQNCVNKLALADGGIIGSYLKDNYTDNGDICSEHVREFVKTARLI